MIFNNITNSIFKKLLDGTIAAGNAKKLGGKGASGGGEKGIPFISSDYGVMEIGSIIDFHTEQGQDFKARLYVDDNGNLVISGKGIISTGADLANYLPKSGGEIANADIEPLIINRLAGANSFLGFQGNGAQFGGIGFVGVDHLVRRSADGTVMKKILDEGNVGEYALPKTGGEITTNGISTYLPQVTLTLKNGVNDGGAMVRFDDAKGFLGFLGFENVHTPIFSDSNGNPYPLLHTGNVGSYAIPKHPSTYANLNFDTAIENAIYYGGGSPAQEGATNYPSDSTGTLATFGNSTVCSQMYFTYDGTVYNRSRYHSIGWSP